MKRVLGRSPRAHAGLALFAAGLMLAGCAGQAPRPAAERLPAPGASEAEKPPLAAGARRGGYYKDDGPGDSTPPNLDAVPDAVPRAEPLHRFANNPYTVLGRDYVPAKALRPHRERGIASWYGRKFHGQKTSSGEAYDMYAMTAAHPTLPIPSYVRVTRVGDGRSVVVRVNDRGPFHAGRIIDLSYTAAHKLGLVGNGSGLVEVEAILPGAAPAPVLAAAPESAEGNAGNGAETRLVTPVASVGGQHYLQLGAFSSRDNAENLRAHLYKEFDWLGDVIHIVVRGDGLHRLHLGPYGSREEAQRMSVRLAEALGYKPTTVLR